LSKEQERKRKAA
jgi:hypothetical protein